MTHPSSPRQVGSIYEHFCKKYNIYGWLSPWPAYTANRVKLPLARTNGVGGITSAGNEQRGYITHISNIRILCIEQYVSHNFATLKEHFHPGTPATKRGDPRLTTFKKMQPI